MKQKVEVDLLRAFEAFAPHLAEIISAAVRDQVGQIISQQKSPVEPEPVEDSLLTPGEAAEILRVSRRTLHRWKNKGKIPHVRIGEQIRYKRSELEKLMQ